MSYKVIVVGTDGSDRATVAVSEALALAKVSGAELHAVHMVHPAVSAGFADTRSAQFEVAGMRDEAEKIKAKLLADAESEGVSLVVHNPGGDDAADAILSIAEAVGADLIVVGNRGMSGMARFVLGSVPNKVAHRCPCSVLIVDTDRA
jgi:nucleotide-binding universal stress UspA family protein